MAFNTKKKDARKSQAYPAGPTLPGENIAFISKQ